MAAQVTGRVHSVESFGTVDGPGVRFVVFLQGCPMRCLYCHNPDTWDPGGGVPTTVEELLAQYARNEAFYRKGGITVTGGEPLLQIEFVTALFREAKRRGIHTCLDTSGATFRPEPPFVGDLYSPVDGFVIKSLFPVFHSFLYFISSGRSPANGRFRWWTRGPRSCR